MIKHNFHIPVMGIGFTIDTPLKVSHLGIDSVISLVDDILIEKLRKMYCEKFELSYQEISDKLEDFRAKRITSYLNLINDAAHKKFADLINSAHSTGKEIKEYVALLPNASQLKEEFEKLTSNEFNAAEIKKWLKENLTMGSVDVNIMTKVDKDNFIKNDKLSTEYNDAHAALRGYACSKLNSSVILSAGMNPRLYSYLENFDDFFPDENGNIKKKIVLKVSDYRSALIQGKFLAKKGIWVSEFRIESGLNCGGHAFATDGYLMGPIMAQFRDNKQAYIDEIHAILISALSSKGREVPKQNLSLKITAQGGVGTAEEHQFLLDHYKVDSVGWGTPFLLVPEATTVDKVTLDKLVVAKEEDLYLSDISPLGIPFHNLRGNTKDLEKFKNIDKNRPGSSCPKKFVALNKDYSDKGLCTASRQYQHIKIKELDELGLSEKEYTEKFNKITEKSCTCVGLGTSALLAYGLDTKTEGSGVSICPGPNMAYYSKIMTLKEMVDHIYGRDNVISRTDRPHMFIKELGIYLDYLKNKIEESRESMNKKQEKYLLTFTQNLNEGITYYQELFESLKGTFENEKDGVQAALAQGLKTLEGFKMEIEALSLSEV
ncbi:hypothetical protein QSE00_01395 [Arenibacter sp. M-2]|uniref:hypothetical protein n=1 Tax=Arenibacter sp. M-2 TaxID=3053612 RepID=UPI0025700E31|nr:hypothetical protein [Arenibacter sp. M-2]MDL5510450.1 hypothetical protein [Arenibacter sp. M-2]|tara:strand:- start:41459 stop:43267 length:1809 start_codon:yes stop_codon:yes gene_type:complete